tara:strand:- start:1450 stop:2418 length:969 start_codon:yes stop_codon:yes gene_type:complete
MPRPVSAEKELLKLIEGLQDKCENLSGQFNAGQVHMNEHALNELSKHNAKLFKYVKGISDERDRLRSYVNNLQNQIALLTSSKWYKRETNDPSYHKRQVKTRQQKIGSKTHKLCDCGDWISSKSTYWNNHRKTHKCCDNRFRIKYEKSTYKIKKYMGLDQLLMLNGHLFHKKTEPEHKREGGRQKEDIGEGVGFEKFNTTIPMISPAVKSVVHNLALRKAEPESTHIWCRMGMGPLEASIKEKQKKILENITPKKIRRMRTEFWFLNEIPLECVPEVVSSSESESESGSESESESESDSGSDSDSDSDSDTDDPATLWAKSH